MQKKYLAIAAAVILSAGLTLTAQLSPNPHTLYTRRLPELTQTVETLLKNPSAAQSDIPGVQSVTYWDGENPIIEFTTCASGIVPSSGYYGLYYSVSGSPAAFQNTDQPLTRAEDGLYWQAEGDNWGKTTRLDDHWFTFEAHF